MATKKISAPTPGQLKAVVGETIKGVKKIRAVPEAKEKTTKKKQPLKKEKQEKPIAAGMTHIEFPRNATPAQMLRAIKRMAHELRPDVNPPVEDEPEEKQDKGE